MFEGFYQACYNTGLCASHNKVKDRYTGATGVNNNRANADAKASGQTKLYHVYVSQRALQTAVTVTVRMYELVTLHLTAHETVTSLLRLRLV